MKKIRLTLQILGVLVVSALFFVTLSLVSDETTASSEFSLAMGDSLTPEGRDTTLVGVLAPSGNFDWTVVGSIFNPKTGRENLAWWESDGSRPSNQEPFTWKLFEANSTNEDQKFLAVSANENIQVAVGAEGKGDSARGAVWYRMQKGDWKVAPQEGLQVASELFDVDVADDGRAIVVGKKFENGRDNYKLWISKDGRQYSRASLTFEDGVIVSSVAVGDLGYVAIATHQKDDGIREGLVWVSENGNDWRAATSGNFSRANNVNLTGVASEGNRFVIVGGIQQGVRNSPMAWISTNLSDWIDEGVFFDQGTLSSRNNSSGHFAAGINSSGDNLVTFSNTSFLQQVWRSTSGNSWDEIGNLKEVRESGVPVIDAAVATTTSDGIVTVAIANDTSIWEYESSNPLIRGWREFRSNTTLPRITDGPFVSSVSWDGERNQFVAAGGFVFSRDNKSENLFGGRVWSSSNLGEQWGLLGQFDMAPRNVGDTRAIQNSQTVASASGPVSQIVASANGIAAIGNQDSTLAAEAAATGTVNSQGLFWHTDGESKISQYLPYNDLAPSGFPFFVLKTAFTAIAPTKNGFLVGGWAFTQISGDTVDGWLYSIKERNNGFTYDVVLPPEFGLSTEKDDAVATLCSSAKDLDRVALFGTITELRGPRISSALTTDGGTTWELTQSADNSFSDKTAQTVNACVSVECSGRIEMFEEQCRGGDSFFLATGQVVLTDSQTDGRVWWSKDGRDWRVLSVHNDFVAAGNQNIVDVAATKDGVVFAVNFEEGGVTRGRLYLLGASSSSRASTDSLRIISEGFADNGVPVEFLSIAISPNNIVVVSGLEDSRVARIWHSEKAVFVNSPTSN